MERSKNLKLYNEINYCKQEIQRLRNLFEDNSIGRGYFGHRNNWEYCKRFANANEINETSIAETFKYANSLSSNIRANRKRIKEIREVNNGVHSIWSKSKQHANNLIKVNFQQSPYNMNFVRFSNCKEGYLPNLSESKSKYRSEYNIPLSINWYRSVCRKGIAFIAGTNSNLFTVKAIRIKNDSQEMKSFKENSSYKLPNCTIFKATTIRFKRNCDPYLESGYLLIDDYEYEGEKNYNILRIDRHWNESKFAKIHAYKPTIEQSAKLLNRRIKKEILDSMSV